MSIEEQLALDFSGRQESPLERDTESAARRYVIPKATEPPRVLPRVALYRWLDQFFVQNDLTRPSNFNSKADARTLRGIYHHVILNHYGIRERDIVPRYD